VDFSPSVCRLASPDGFLEVRLNLLFSVSIDGGIIRVSKTDVKENARRLIYSSSGRTSNL
jgi:hypothetical protein